MIVAAHQPHYLPWLGYLDKLAKADVFVVMDDLPFEAQNFQHRQRMKLQHGGGWLTVPLGRGDDTDRICDQRIDNTADWRRLHWTTLERNYRHAPYFDRYADELREIYSRPWTSLLDLDMQILDSARSWLGIRTAIVRSSSLDLKGHHTDRLIDMCKKLGARAYISGCGAATNYLDVERMGRAGIGVIWQAFVHPVYPQRYPERGFVSHLAFFDLLFHCGDASRDVLFDRSHPARVRAA